MSIRLKLSQWLTATPAPEQPDAHQRKRQAIVRGLRERRAQDQALQRMAQLYAALSQVNQAIVWMPTQEALFAKICEVLVVFGRFKLAWIGRHDPATRIVTPLCLYGEGKEVVATAEIRTDATPAGSGAVGRAIREERPCVFNDFVNESVSSPWTGLLHQAGLAAAAAFPVREQGQVRFVLTVYSGERGFFGPAETALLVEAAMDVSFALDHFRQEEARLQGEEALRQSEARLRTLTLNAPDTIVMLDGQGRVLYVNRPLPGMVQEDTWLLWIHRADRPLAQDTLKAALFSGQNQECEVRGAGSGQETRWFRYRFCPIPDRPGDEKTLLFCTDLTQARAAQEEQARLEARLQQAQRLESLGSLAGGVAHDMNNVLGAILSLASANREHLDPAEPFAGALDTIVNACLRGRDVVKSLLYFAHKDLAQVSAVDLNGVVRDMVQLLAHTTLKRIELKMDLQPNLGLLEGDSGAISHSLMNLCVNAMDAMPGGGRLTLSTRELPQGGLELAVRDTGHGMAPEVLEKAMEPFFTTKPMGKGTGLGLAMVYATMKAHDGTLELRSAPGEGTHILLAFPAARRLAGTAAARSEAAPAPGPAPTLRILLVDDDELIREAVGPMLDMLGHEVHTAAGGQEALDQLGQGLEVDLVILDLNMPGLDGAATLPLLLELRPGQTVLLSSGYSDQDSNALGAGRPRVFSIRKPFTLAEIRQKLASLGLGVEVSPGR